MRRYSVCYLNIRRVCLSLSLFRLILELITLMRRKKCGINLILQFGIVIQRGKNCAVGHEAPNFELITSTGGKIALSSLRGKYVLIDFWASWCGPCRREIPNIKKIYAEFKDKGLQVVGVSIDSSDKAWKKALEEENMDYLQLYDPEGITSKLYNYNGIPFIILISPEGIILEKGLRGENIREKITEYLK